MEEQTEQQSDTGWRSFDRWAAVLLAAFGVIAAVVGLLVGREQGDPLVALAIYLGGAANAAVYGIAAYGLAVRRPWARPVAVALLALAIVFGLVEIVAHLPGFYIPLGAIAAFIVLLLRPRRRAAWPAGHGRAVLLTLAVAVASYAMVPVAEFAFTGSGLFAVQQDDLDLRHFVSCEPGGETPTTVRATVEWHWKKRPWVPRVDDGLLFRWRVVSAYDDVGEDEAPGPSAHMYLLDAPGTGYQVIESGDGGLHTIHPSREDATGPIWMGQDGPSGNIMRELMQAADQEGARTAAFMIDVGQQQLQDGDYTITLRVQHFPTNHRLLASEAWVDVFYVHAGQWFSGSAFNPARCEWQPPAQAGSHRTAQLQLHGVPGNEIVPTTRNYRC